MAAAPRRLPSSSVWPTSEESLFSAGHHAYGFDQVGAEDDVGVDEAAQRKACCAVGERKRGVEPGRAVRRELQAGHVLDVQLAGRFCDVAEQEHLHVERAPALDRASLQRAGVACERLRHREERQHSSA